MILAQFTCLYYGFTFCFRIRIKYCQNKYHKKSSDLNLKYDEKYFKFGDKTQFCLSQNNFTKKHTHMI